MQDTKHRVTVTTMDGFKADVPLGPMCWDCKAKKWFTTQAYCRWFDRTLIRADGQNTFKTKECREQSDGS